MKIFVYGFPHSGTTILRKIIGSHSKIMDWYRETMDVPRNIKMPVVFKMPALPDNRQENCKRIMIMKNPYDIFGSFYLRFGDKYLTYPGRMIKDYETFVEHFLSTDDFTIKYEELKSRLPELFEHLGFEYEGIKRLRGGAGKGYYLNTPKRKPKSQEDGPDHAYYRLWQINQPFKDMTGQSAKFLPDEGRKLIEKSEIIKKLYG